jgi:hypothetical protein
MKRAGNPSKASQPYIPSYEKGGMVTKPKGGNSGIYTAEMGPPPQDIDSGSAPAKPAPRKVPAPKKK